MQERQQHIDVSLPLFLSSFLSLKINKILKKKEEEEEEGSSPDQWGSVGWALSCKVKVVSMIPAQGTCLGCQFGP